MKDYEYEAFGDRLAEILNRKNMSASELARRLSCNPSTVTGWQRGEGRPGVPELIDAIARELKLTEKERVGLLNDASYGWYVESSTYRINNSQEALRYFRNEAQKRGVKDYVVDELLKMLTQYPNL